jgi:rare lipoprotein A
MSWEDQGRQQHGWFGDGTSSDGTVPGAGQGSGFGLANHGQRIDAAAHVVVAHVPRSDRRRSVVTFDAGALDRLRGAMTAWDGASGLSRDTFRELFLDPHTSDRTVDLLRKAAKVASQAHSHEELRAAGAALSEAMQSIGLDRWPRYLADAADRAEAARASPAQSNKNSPLPASGEASTYGDEFVGRETASGRKYRHEDYTAALLPRSRWAAVPLGTKLRITHDGRSVVVEVNDRGAGNGRDSRVLDLSRAAMAHLIGRKVEDINDNNAGLIHLDRIEIVPPNAKVGPQ